MNNIYLCKPGGVILGTMSGLDENSVSLHKTVGIWELTFNVSKYLYEKGERKTTTYYDFISERMELYLDTEDEKARFIITAEPSVANDGTQEMKSVTAQSIECELQDKFLRLFDINTGQKISQENLLRDDDGHDYNINPYTKLPIDYISVHRDYVSELTTLKDQIAAGYIEWDKMETDDETVQTEMKHFVLVYGEDGLITAEDDTENLFPRYISNLLKVYPRLANNIVYGIDKRADSQTLDEEICTTESYLKIVDDAVHIPLAQFKKETIEGKQYIKDPTENVYPNLQQSVTNLITFYQTYGNQLSMLDLCLEKATNMGWTVGTVPDYIGKRKYSFSVEESAIYTFLTQTCASTMKVVFDFDRVAKKVNIIDVSGDDHEHDTGVFIGLQNLANEINIEESSEDGIRTKFLPKGANDLGITQVNFGESEMIDLDYFMHRTDEDGEHQYVSNEIREKYDAWKSYRENEEITITDIPVYEYDINHKTFNSIHFYPSDVSIINSSEDVGQIGGSDDFYNVSLAEVPKDSVLKVNYTAENVSNSVFICRLSTIVGSTASTSVLDDYYKIYNSKELRLQPYQSYSYSTTIDLQQFYAEKEGYVTQANNKLFLCAIVFQKDLRLKISNIRIESSETITKIYPSRREAYIDLTKRYNQAMVDIDQIDNLLPDDGCLIDYTTFPFEDLTTAWKAYQNALDALLQLYKEDYKVAHFDMDTLVALDVHNQPVTRIDNTMYWHDFDGYVNTIIPNVENALKIYVFTDSEGNFVEGKSYTEVDGVRTWIYYETETDKGNPSYNGNAKIVEDNKSDGYLYDMTLYGRSELDIKRQAWSEVTAQLYKDGFVLDWDSDGIPTRYNTADHIGWEAIKAEHGDQFTSEQDFINKMSQYLDYVSFDVRDNGLTKEQNKGVIRMVEDELIKCDSIMNTLKEYQAFYDEKRTEIANAVNLNSWNFTEKESGIVHSLIREANYGNQNILTTNLDNIVSAIDAQKELYEDASKKLFEMSRPQYSFNISLDNLLSIKEFAPLKSSLQLLNYIYLKLGIYEDAFVRVRLVGMQCNPLISSPDIELEFSNMVYTYDGLSDIDKLLGEASGAVSSGGSTGSGSGSGGTYGTNDADIQVSNNMLNALLSNNGYLSNTQMIITKSETSVGEKLSNAEYLIDGAAVANLIKSSNYNGTNNQINNDAGSIIKLDNGTFNFGGGSLVFNGQQLVVKGIIQATGLEILNDTTIDGEFISGDISSSDGNVNIDLNNGTIKFPGFEIDEQGNGTFNGILTGATGIFETGQINNCIANTLTIDNGGFQIRANDSVPFEIKSNTTTLEIKSDGSFHISSEDSVTPFDPQSGIFPTNSNIEFTNEYNDVKYTTKISSGFIELSKFYKDEQNRDIEETTFIEPGKISVYLRGTYPSGSPTFGDGRYLDKEGIGIITFV